ncbi:MAG: ATP-binding protein [Bacteroidetes bacterium]|nr:ATP-binding protein [Bacteroidota bacterium]MCB0845659.1 ATP-binding protein [Bacteroidota bacterium]MCB0854879.1 ATP-binding protein [Bacteroidota bacterium]
MITRKIIARVLEDLSFFPIVGIIGSRQVGKTTLAKLIQNKIEQQVIFLDLELESDLKKLEDAETYLKQHLDKCVIIDEIQRLPNLFPLLRALVDLNRTAGRYLILGSASPNLVKDSSETLAGRIAYIELSPLSLEEIHPQISMREHWLRGGFPVALLASELKFTWRWLENFLRTFSERDLKELGYEIPPARIKSLLKMLSHLNGQMLNSTQLASSMGLSQPTVKRYIDLLEGGFIITRLQPYFSNVGKRLIKSPKVYFRDSGFFHQLANIYDLESLYGHPLVGASWEAYVIEQIKRAVTESWELYFYRTHQGAEIDLLLITPKGKMIGIEIKYSNAPKVSKGFYYSLEDLSIDTAYVITPESETYTKDKNIVVCGLWDFLENELPKLT